MQNVTEAARCRQTKRVLTRQRDIGRNAAKIARQLFTFTSATHTQTHTHLTSCAGCLQSRVIAAGDCTLTHVIADRHVIADVTLTSLLTSRMLQPLRRSPVKGGQGGGERFGRGEGRERGKTAQTEQQTS